MRPKGRALCLGYRKEFGKLICNQVHSPELGEATGVKAMLLLLWPLLLINTILQGLDFSARRQDLVSHLMRVKRLAGGVCALPPCSHGWSWSSLCRWQLRQGVLAAASPGGVFLVPQLPDRCAGDSSVVVLGVAHGRWPSGQRASPALPVSWKS